MYKTGWNTEKKEVKKRKDEGFLENKRKWSLRDIMDAGHHIFYAQSLIFSHFYLLEIN